MVIDWDGLRILVVEAIVTINRRLVCASVSNSIAILGRSILTIPVTIVAIKGKTIPIGCMKAIRAVKHPNIRNCVLVASVVLIAILLNRFNDLRDCAF